MRNKNRDTDSDTFIPLPRRDNRNKDRKGAKTSKATEVLVESLAERENKLSKQLLVLTKLYRVAYRLLPASAKERVDQLKSELESVASLEDVHPEVS